ncbi:MULTISPECIES: hypothetical protein [Thermomonosporaceae]|uniref:hypothetical protein n=1 Tax=Thermomonosporaceae TaxID=2012 RepID=UPI00255B0177|nr:MULTISPECIES: hypothetical protein [Thermomonosporaceae]MDL4773931.1 hypothetical protein [Actinomadura xylanilytica]
MGQDGQTTSETTAPPDYGLISPISLPDDGRMPDAAAGSSTPAEYDSYFRLVRERPELATWSQSCVEVQRRVLDDLEATGLSAQDRCDMLAGFLVVAHGTLEKWLDLHGAAGAHR